MTMSSHAPGKLAHKLAGLPPVVLVIGYVALCLTPLTLSVVQGFPGGNVYRDLSTGLVMVGYAMMLVQFLLSGRFEWLSGRIGIDRTMRFHQVVSFVILIFIIIHPLLYAVPRLSSGPAAALATLERMFSSQNLRSGVIAWFLVIALVPLAVFRDRLRIPYELWRLSHGLMAIAIATLAMHHTLRVGHYAGGRWLGAFWTGATLLAVIAMLHIYIVKPLLQRREPYRVVSNRKVAARMWEIVVEPISGEAISFAPGQFVWLNLGHSSFSLTEHPFSISSAPAERPRIAFTIKESGDFTDHIGEVPVGTHAYLDGPHGHFTLTERQARGVVFIAGGVGLAPIMGILRQLRAEQSQLPLQLIYGNRIETQILYRDEIEALRNELDLDVRYVLSEPPPGWSGGIGELSAELLERCLGGEFDWTYLVCGPPAMMDAVEQALIERGVPRGRIITERFRYN